MDYRFTWKHRNKTMILIWLLFGILCSVIAVQIRLSGGVNLEKFYDVGDKFIVSYQFYTISYEGCEYQSDGRYHITQNDVDIPFYAYLKSDNNWNYIYLDLRDLNCNVLFAQITEINTAEEIVSTQRVELVEGMNEIRISPDPSHEIILHMENQSGTVFRIHSMQFRERKSYFETGKVIKMMLLCMAIYIVCTGIAYVFLFRHFHWENIYVIMDGLTWLYAKMTGWIPLAGSRFREKTVRYLRILCFLIMIFTMLYTENYGSYNNKQYYHIFLLFNCVIIFFLTLFSTERVRVQIYWKNPLLMSWVFYSVCACISDLIVHKSQMFTGVMMLIFYGMLFYTLSGMKKPVMLLRDFVTAVEISYVVLTIICLFCRPIAEMQEGRYIGGTVSPYSFALFVGIVTAIFIAELDQWLLERQSICNLIFYLWGIISGLYFIWLTQSRNGVLAVFVCFMILTARVFFMRKSKHYRSNAILAVIVCVLMSIPSLWIQDWCIRNLPQTCGTTLYFDNDNRMIGKPVIESRQDSDDNLKEFWDSGTDIVYAQEADVSLEKRHLLKTAVSLDVLSSGRITIYKEYIARMNLFGHKKDPVISGVAMRAHNAVLQTGYRYGIFSMIPYTMMLLYVIYYSFCYLKTNWQNKTRYAFLPVALSVTGFILMMLDNVERNFRYLPWISFYLLVGFLGTTEKQ